MNTKRKTRALLAVALAATTVGAFALAGGGTASAADGDQVLAIDFSGLAPTADVAAAQASATTDFTKANPIQGFRYGDNSMYDEGTYIIGSNPHDYHVAWVDYSAQPGYVENPKLILNGFTTGGGQNVFTVTTKGQVCTTPGSSITFSFKAKMTNILPLNAVSDGGAAISVKINGDTIGSQVTLSNDPSNPIEIVGSAPALADGTLVVSVINDSTVLVGNDFSLDDITLTQVGDCAPPACVPTTKGVWFNYTGNYTGTGSPALNDPKWHELPAQPGGQHALSLRGFDKPYQPGAVKGKGDWFVWRNLGTVCPES